MLIALVSDSLTRHSLASECEVIVLTPLNWRVLLRVFRPDFLLVESAWSGLRDSWKYRIAAYPDHPERNNRKLADLVRFARDRGIPTVFWNKEDSVHFSRFIESAKLFDHVFTVDENAVAAYRRVVAPTTTVEVLPFPVQTRFHRFTGFDFKHVRANFVGSYSRHIHDRRRLWQDGVFGAAVESGLGLTIIDRNSDRRSNTYRFPELPGVDVLPAVEYPETARIYRNYLVSINVNTIEDSATMYSRRLAEIIACGGIAVTNPTPAVERYFADYCHTVANAEEARELFGRLRHGPSADDLARAEAGARYVAAEHTWARALDRVVEMLGTRVGDASPTSPAA